MRNDIKLIVIDVDGTLLTRDKKIPRLIIPVIEALRKEGVEVTLASGRTIESTLRLGQSIGIKLPVVASNGSVIGDNRTILRIYPCNKEEITELVYNLGYRFPYFMFILGGALHLLKYKRYRFLLSTWGPDSFISILNPYSVIKREDIIAVHFLLKENEIEELLNVTYSLNETNPFYFPSAHYPYIHLELRDKTRDKGVALLELCEIVGISPQNTMVIGDWINDIPMFRVAGIKVSVKEAIPSLKEISDFVIEIPAQDNGIPLFLAEYFKVRI